MGEGAALPGARALGPGRGPGRPHLRRGRRLRPQRRRLPHHRAVAGWRGRGRVHAAGPRRRRPRRRRTSATSTPTARPRRSTTRPRPRPSRKVFGDDGAAGHVDQGRHRPPHRRRRRGRGGRLVAGDAGRRWCPPTANHERTERRASPSTSSPASPARSPPRRSCRTRSGSAATTPRLVLAPGRHDRRVIDGRPGRRPAGAAPSRPRSPSSTGGGWRGSASTAGKHRGRDRPGRGRGRRARSSASPSTSACRSSGEVATLGRRRQRGRGVAARVGPGGPGAGRRVGRGADRASRWSGRAWPGPPCCSAWPTTW